MIIEYFHTPLGWRWWLCAETGRSKGRVIAQSSRRHKSEAGCMDEIEAVFGQRFLIVKLPKGV